MSISIDFNRQGYETAKVNDYVLAVKYHYTTNSAYYSYHTYDFAGRVMTTRTGSSDGGVAVTPFSQLDPDSLEAFRQRLIALGGKPPELTQPEKPSQPRSGNSFNP